MTSSTICSTTDAARLAAALLGQAVDQAVPVAGGGNNRLFRITAADQTCHALKFYPHQEQDPRDRLGQEFEFLGFLNRQGVKGVPLALAADRNNHCALYNWIVGVTIHAPGPEEIDAMLVFLEQLHIWRHAPDAQQLATASDNCFSAQAVVSQLSRRLARCWEVATTEPVLHDFLEAEFTPVSRKILLQLRDMPGFSQPIPVMARTLSPSDFGLHNALRRPDDGIVFLDFEYAGWDDPAKLVADVIWHPGTDLPEDLAERFSHGAKKIYDTGGVWGFGQRFARLFPVFGLVWCLILLNEFLPERWQRRVLAGREGSREDILCQQLEKARWRLEKIEKN
ncbi:MAG: aminoglycoside phosphotransferase family protein [Magnetococcales bacterium]|nr:aminoglycoside phosphotransferase family protein [Magnetococcales bacterium]